MVTLRSSGIDISDCCLMFSDQDASTFDSVVHDSFVGVVMASDMSKPCHLQTFNNDEELFLLARMTFDLAPYIIIGFVLRVRDAD